MDSEKIKDLFDIELDAIPFEKEASPVVEESTPPSVMSMCWWC